MIGPWILILLYCDLSPPPRTNSKCITLCIFNWASRHEGVLGSAGIASRIVGLGTRLRWVVSFTPRPLHPRGKRNCYPLDRRLDGPQSRSRYGDEEESSQPLPGLEPPEHPARSFFDTAVFLANWYFYIPRQLVLLANWYFYIPSQLILFLINWYFYIPSQLIFLYSYLTDTSIFLPNWYFYIPISVYLFSSVLRFDNKFG
jgi:hypothetical protein